MKAPGFFDVEECLAGLSKKGDVLEQLNRTIDFALFRPDLERAVPRSNGLGDEATEYFMRDRLTWKRFLGLGISDPVPDANTIWTFREHLTKANAIKGQQGESALRYSIALIARPVRATPVMTGLHLILGSRDHPLQRASRRCSNVATSHTRAEGAIRGANFQHPNQDGKPSEISPLNRPDDAAKQSGKPVPNLSSRTTPDHDHFNLKTKFDDPVDHERHPTLQETLDNLLEEISSLAPQFMKVERTGSWSTGTVETTSPLLTLPRHGAS
jgi:hypothetical protein